MPVHDLDDLLRRATTAARRSHPGARLRGLQRLEGGVSSLTFASAVVSDHIELPVVIKVAPAGLPPVRNRDVLRQARLLRLLADVDGFPVPHVAFEDEGRPPGVPPLFGMELCAGESYEPLLDHSDEPPTAAVAAERMRVAARVLGRLQSDSPASLGLSAEPATSAADELERWQRLFATVDADIAVGHEELHARLAAAVPQTSEPRLLHGDYRLANMLFVGAELSAVIDWEIWSIGDPRSDLAWLLMHLEPAHVFQESRSAANLAAGAAMPTRDELIDEYLGARRQHGSSEEQVRGATADLAWFSAVCAYKTAATIAVIWKRERKLASPDPKLVVAARHLDEVLQAGHQALSSGPTAGGTITAP